MTKFTEELEVLYGYGLYFIPTGSNKQPAIIKGYYWGVTQATRDRAKIEEWLKEGHGLAIAGGEVENKDKFLVIIDIDNDNGQGFETMKEMELDYSVLPPTLTIESPSGGNHKYFFSSTQIGSTTDVFRKKFKKPMSVDIKGYHGYCLCPPTAKYQVKDNAPIADLPEDWEKLLNAMVGCRLASQSDESFSDPPNVEEIEKFNNHYSIHQILEEHNYERIGPKTYCHPFGATSRNNVYILKNKSYLTHGAEEISWHYGAHDQVQGGPHDAFDLFRLLDHNGDWESAVQGVRHEFAFKTNDHQLNLCRAGSIGKNNRKEMISKHWQENDIVMLNGVSEGYKTFYIFDAAFSMATELPFLGVFPCHKYQSLSILTESNDYYDRREAWVKVRSAEYNISERELREKIHENCFVRRKSLKITDDITRLSFEAMARNLFGKKFNPRIIFIDHLSGNWGGEDENSNAELAKYLNVLHQLAVAKNITFVIIHHPTKDGKVLRGGSVLKNNVPVVYNFKVEEGRRFVEQNKCGYYNGFQEYELQKTITDLYWNDNFVIPTMRTGLTLKANIDFQPLPAKKQGKKPTYTDDEIMEYIGDYEVSVSDLSKMLTKVDSRTLYFYLDKLVEKGKLVKLGTSKNCTWKKKISVDI